MAKRRSRGKPSANSIPGDFSWRLIDMLESPAFRILSLSARKILDRLEIEFHQHGGNPFDNGDGLPCAYDHFEEYGVHRHAIGPAIRELVALGFVEVTRPGCAGNASERQSARYRLTYRRAYSNHQITDEWRRRQFGSFGDQPWFIIGAPGYIKRDYEMNPFIKHYFLPQCPCVGVLAGFTSDMRPIDFPDYGDGELTDEQFVNAYNRRDPATVAGYEAPRPV
jgi:hypothetical protein